MGRSWGDPILRGSWGDEQISLCHSKLKNFYLRIAWLVQISIVIGKELRFVLVADSLDLFDVFLGDKLLLVLSESDELNRVSTPDLVSRNNSSWGNNTVREDDGSSFQSSSFQDH